jgi:hypothetical protein
MAILHNDKDLNAATTGTGPSHDTQGHGYHALFTIWSAGVSAGQVLLEGSCDGQAWTQLASRSFAASSNFVDMAGDSNATPKNPVLVRFVRCRISTTVAGGTVTAWVSSGSFGGLGDVGWSG